MAAINLGRIRADDLLAVEVSDRCANALAFLIRGSSEAATLEEDVSRVTSA